MKKFKALMIDKKEGTQQLYHLEIGENELMDGDTLVKVDYSTINYKDALAITGKRSIIKKWPMIPGVDFSGTIEKTTNKNFEIGEKVILNGCGVGEKHFGGFSAKARINADWLIKKPKKISLLEAMSIGSAGLTSMLCIMEIEKVLRPNDGKILVTGASGGVGSIAVMILSKMGYYVVACSGKKEESFLKNLGASEIIDRNYFSENNKLLNHQEFKGVIDVVGSKTLANIISKTYYGGVVVACGLAQGVDLPTNMMPFIIRAITLKGVESIYVDKKIKEDAWERISKYIDKDKLKLQTSVINFSEIETYSKKLINSKITGRVVVDNKN